MENNVSYFIKIKFPTATVSVENAYNFIVWNFLNNANDSIVEKQEDVSGDIGEIFIYANDNLKDHIKDYYDGNDFTFTFDSNIEKYNGIKVHIGHVGE